MSGKEDEKTPEQQAQSQIEKTYDIGEDEDPDGDEDFSEVLNAGEKTADEKDSGGSSDEGDTSESEEDVAPEVPEELAEIARDFGLDDDAISALHQAGHLEKHLSLLAKELEEEESGKKGDEEQEEEEKESEEEDDLISLDPDFYDAELVKTLRKLKQYVDEKVGSVAQLTEAQQQSLAGQQFVEWFDSKLASLPDEEKAILGDQPGTELDVNSEQMKLREAIVQEMNVIDAGRDALGQPKLSDDELFERAKTVVLTREGKDVNRERLRKELRRRSSQTISRPTRQTAPKPKGEKAALQTLKTMLSEFEAESVDEEDTDEDLP